MGGVDGAKGRQGLLRFPRSDRVKFQSAVFEKTSNLKPETLNLKPPFSTFGGFGRQALNPPRNTVFG